MTLPAPIFDELMDDTDLATQFEVAFILDEIDPASRAIIALAEGNKVMAFIHTLPDVPRWQSLRKQAPATDSVTVRAHP